MISKEELSQIENPIVFDSFIKAMSVLKKHEAIDVSISGGADSDIVLDLIEKIKTDENISYVWFDTGLEYQATKDHLEYLEKKYGITIEREKAVKPIPIAVKEYGLPFLSKVVSQKIELLQAHNFEWKDEPLEVLLDKYPTCRDGVRWWCNAKPGERFNIGRNKWLKEFMIKNPPKFKISNQCCLWAKKKVSLKRIHKMGGALSVVGVRKAEGGARSSLKNCYDAQRKKGAQYRPLFWYSNEDKKWYEDKFCITHSKCYTNYGMKRTGCAGCPFNSKFDEALNIMSAFEPKLYKACVNVFGNSYEYTRKYHEFRKEMNSKVKAQKTEIKGQTSLF